MTRVFEWGNVNLFSAEDDVGEEYSFSASNQTQKSNVEYPFFAIITNNQHNKLYTTKVSNNEYIMLN